MQMFEIEGLGELQQRLESLKPTLARKHMRAAVNRGANILYDEARNRAPVRADGKPKRVKNGVARGGQRLPGFLLEDIQVRRTRVRGAAWGFALKIGTTARAYYARFIEFGTQHQPSRPWLRPALDTTVGEVLYAIRDYLSAVLR